MEKDKEIKRLRSALSIAMRALSRIEEDCQGTFPPPHQEIVDFIGEMVGKIVAVLR